MATAREKIVDEMNALDDKSRDRKSIERIGEYILDMLPSATVEDKVLQESKTLKGAMAAMTSYARNANSSCITDEEGFKVVCDYFGIAQAKSITSDVDDLFA